MDFELTLFSVPRFENGIFKQITILKYEETTETLTFDIPYSEIEKNIPLIVSLENYLKSVSIPEYLQNKN